ncbi:MAG: hypothetical protein GQ535_05225 [Rhodobacteraceae bacterium]|nr:hypothetical protein [Paracoccaceae bacterium]
MERGLITIESVGAFHVSGPAGEDLTPKGARLRAILAVIALSPRKKVARRWLEALMWPDREAEQASGSLRQALSGIRRSLGPFAHILMADRTDISLISEKCRIDVLDSTNSVLKRLDAGHNFLEGVDIPSENFEDWLRQERSTLYAKLDAHVEKQASHSLAAGLTAPEIELKSPEIPRLYTVAETKGVRFDAFIAEAISTQMAQTASEHVRSEVFILDGKVTPAVLAPGAKCTIRVTEQNNQLLALVRLTKEPGGKLIWTRQISIDAADNLAAVDAAASLAIEATEAFAICAHSASNAEKANALAASALQHVFSFDTNRLIKADTLLAQAHDLDPFAPRPALRALSKAFISLENNSGASEQTRMEVNALIAETLRVDSNNALALAFLADVYDLVFKDTHTALSYAQVALKNNPGSGYAYASLGGLEMRRGREKVALTSAWRAQRQLENTSLQVFSLMRYCVAAMSAGEFAEAKAAARKASLLAPTSRPPLRHLYALYLHEKDTKRAQETLATLQKLEPNFSMAYLRENPDFPAASLRHMGFDKMQDVEV